MNVLKFRSALTHLATVIVLMSVTTLWAQTGGKLIYSFNKPTPNPTGGLIADSAGNLYGLTDNAAYELSPMVGGGWNFNVIYDSSTYPGLDGQPLMDAAGNLYITNWEGGPGGSHCGGVYELTPSGGSWTATTLYAFSGADGCGPTSGVVMDAAGNLYGSARGGPNDEGVVFELTLANGTWTETDLFAFANYTDPTTPVTIDAKGNLYVGDESDIFEISPISGGGWSVNSIYTFGRDDGSSPSGLTVDSAGNLYGMNDTGGLYHYGTAFQLHPVGDGTWSYKVLHSFGGIINGMQDGMYPGSSLSFDAAGNAWGSTGAGGTYGKGTIFRLTPGTDHWPETAHYSFTGKQDGAIPVGLLLLYQGNFYGVAIEGGIHGIDGGDGVAFQFAP